MKNKELLIQIAKSKIRIELNSIIEAYYRIIYIQNNSETKLIDREKFIQSVKKLTDIYNSLKRKEYENM